MGNDLPLRKFFTEEFRRKRVSQQLSFFEEQRSLLRESLPLIGYFHDNTKYRKEEDHRVLRSFALFQGGEEYKYATAEIGPKDYQEDIVELPYPEGDSVSDTSLRRALIDRRSKRSFSGEPVTIDELSEMVYYSSGITGNNELSIAGNEIEQKFRSYPSGGGLFPVEIYLLMTQDSPIGTGVFHYNPMKHHLAKIANSDISSDNIPSYFSTDSVDIDKAGVIIILTAAFERIRAKYGPRSYRYVLQESGHLAQNLLLITTTLGLAGVPVGGFYDEHIEDLLNINNNLESPIYSVIIGRSDSDD